MRSWPLSDMILDRHDIPHESISNAPILLLGADIHNQLLCAFADGYLPHGHSRRVHCGHLAVFNKRVAAIVRGSSTPFPLVSLTVNWIYLQNAAMEMGVSGASARHPCYLR